MDKSRQKEKVQKKLASLRKPCSIYWRMSTARSW